MIDSADLVALGLTLRLAAISTAVLLVIGTPVAWWIAFGNSRYRAVVEAITSLPLVLPPTVLGFYLLIALGPEGVGGLLGFAGIRTLAFSFSGLVIGSVIYSLPFVVQPLKNGFLVMGREPLESGAVLGANPWQCFRRIALPLCKPAYLSAAVLAFAHTLGEFGVVLMIGGNIPGETEVVSIAIYNHVESMDYGSAHWLSLILIALSLSGLLLIQSRRLKIWPAAN